MARHSTRRAQQQLGARLRQLYEQGDVEPLEVLFGARSLDDALTSLDNLNRVASQDKAVLQQVKSAREQLTTAVGTLAARAAQLRDAIAQAAATEAQLASTRAARESYISSLATRRSLTEHQIGALVARANAASVRSTRIVRASASVTPVAALAPTSNGGTGSIAPVATPAPPTVPSGRTITVSATGYSLGGTTSTGLSVGWGVAAVDPDVIPLGSHLTVPGYGEAVAADTGGAIVGATIDLWFPSIAQANAWGRRVVTIVVH